MSKGEQYPGADDLKRLLARLDPDELRAWQEYEKLRQRLIMFFEPHFQAPELAEEVLDRIARRSDLHELTSVTEFAFGVARNVRKETLRKASSVVELLHEGQLMAKGGNPEAVFLASSDASHKRECFLQCLQQLTPAEQQLIFEYYPADGDALEERRQRLAEATGINWGTLRTKVVRLRGKLMECCTERYAQKSSRPEAYGRFQGQS
jgi:DNA-directed RNA polymerase specialized sigma24 family protein